MIHVRHSGNVPVAQRRNLISPPRQWWESLIGAIILAMSSYDAHQDRKHSVTINSPVPIFAGRGDGACGGNQLTTVQPGTVLHVHRIRYWKNCATLDVVLPDGRHGYVVPGIGDFTVTPPLG